MYRRFIGVLIVVIVFFSFTMCGYGSTPITSEVVRGKIIRINEEAVNKELHGSYVSDIQSLVIRITQGTLKGEEIAITHKLSGNKAFDIYYRKGDRVLVWLELNNGYLQRAFIREITRDHYLLYLLLFFLLSILLVGRGQGIKTILTLGITAFLVIKALLPLILKGFNPILVTVGIASIVISITLVLISGFNRKTYSAILGTIGGVIIAGIIASVMTSLTRLTGFSSSEAQMLMHIPQGTKFNFQGLLFSGIIIGAMGAVLDIGMSIASAIDEIKRAKPNISTKELITSGLNVGKDIMGTMSNTLILAYTGASIHLLLVLQAYNIPISRIFNVDAIATEVVRILSGTIGLIYAIPLTAIAAGLLYKDVNMDKNQPLKHPIKSKNVKYK